MSNIDLKLIFEKYPVCITNGEKLKAFLDDLYPRESKAVKKVLSTMVNDGIAQEIRGTSVITDIKKSQWKKKLEDDYGWSEKIIITCIDMFIGTSDSVCMDGAVKSEGADTIIRQRPTEEISAISTKKEGINLASNISSTISKGLVSKDKSANNVTVIHSPFPDFEIKNGVLLKYTGHATGVTIPDSVTSIDSNAFYGCSGLTSVTIPDCVTDIGSSAFYGCSRLANVTIPDGITHIGESAFNGCSGLTNVTIPDCVTYIGSSTFRDCIGLTSVIIPDRVTSIGYTCFYGCKKLESVTISGSVVSIGNSAFRNCSKLQTIRFDGTKKQWLQIKKGDKYLKDSAVKEIVCSDGVVSESIGNKPTEPKKPISLPKDNIKSGSTAYKGIGAKEKNKKLTAKSSQNNNRVTAIRNPVPDFEIKNGVLFKYTGHATSITIPGSVTSINGNAFYGCSGLTSVIIPDGVTDIGSSAFYGCSGLANVTIPVGVTHIGASAFNGCSGLTTVTIPDSVLSIGGYAFCGCRNLVNVTIPYGVISIDSNVFRGCGRLASVTIPQSVTSIDNSAFYGCSVLDNITIPGSVISINHYAFSGCNKLQTIRFDGTKDQWLRITKGDKYLKDTAVKEIVCSDGVVSIFFKNRTVASKKREPSSNDNINSGSTEFEVYSFKDKNKKTIAKSSQIINDVKPVHDTSRDFEITNGVVVKYMGHAANVTIPRSVTSIGKRAFKCNVGKKNTSVLNACEQIKKVVVSEGVTHIKEMAFQGCPKLKIIQFSECLRVIGYSAFKNCKKLKKITLPVSVHYIGEMAFCGCKSLRKIRFNGTVQQWSHIRKEKDYLQDSSVKKVICSDGKVLINNL